jgi:cobalt-zinc-cadmium efflux system membrane fusion protein
MLHSIKNYAPRMLAQLPTIAVLVLLGGIAYWGREHDWRWGEKKDDKKEEKRAEESWRPPDVEEGQLGVSAFDATLPITHDPKLCKAEGRDIEFADADAVRKAGIFTGTVGERALEDVLTVTGAADFDPTRVARVAPRVGGTIWRMDRQVGDPVGPGDLLAVIDSNDVGRAKTAFAQAKVQLDLKKQFREGLQPGVTSVRTVMEADAALREAHLTLTTAHQALLNLGYSFELADAEKKSDAELARWLRTLGFEDAPKISGGGPAPATNNLLPVRNPLPAGGVVLQREGVKGEPVAAMQQIYLVGDTSRMLLLLDVRQEDRRHVAPGLPVSFVPDGESAAVTGKIDWVDREVDPKTRTVKARVHVDNSDGRLAAKTFGAARITLHASRPVLVVPEEAVQWEGCSHVVFVLEREPEKKSGDAEEKAEKDEKKVKFEVRKVKLGVRSGGFVEVLSGVSKGEKVAVLGSHVLKSELFKDRLGTPEE